MNNKRKYTLIIMAAGIGSRYGGLKQLDYIGPNGETLLEYSLYDAINAGFNKFVFVIRSSMKESFKKIINKLPDYIEAICVYQSNTVFISHDIYSKNRKKPWGTGHALLTAASAVKESFGVINADDFYGPKAYKYLIKFLNGNNVQKKAIIVGYRLHNTLSSFGSVSRGICSIDKTNTLVLKIEEYHCIKRTKLGIRGIDKKGNQVYLKENELVSLNFWGFSSRFFKNLQEGFFNFLQKNIHNDSSEYYLSEIVNNSIEQENLIINFIDCEESWIGVTYKEDKIHVVNIIKEKIKQRIYPSCLWC